MALRLMGGVDSGLISGTATQNEFDAISVGGGNNFQGTNGCSSPYALYTRTGGGGGVSQGSFNWGSDDAIVYVSCWVMFTTVPSAITAFLAVLDSGGTQLFSLRVNASGYWQVNNNANATVYTSTSQKPIANMWTRIEIYWKQDAVNGEFTVYIGNFADPDLTKTGLNNGAAQPRQLVLGVVEAQVNAPERYLDNWIVSTTGPIGRSFVTTLTLIATDAGGGNWTVQDGGKTDYEVLSEHPWNDSDNGSIYSNTANQEDRMKFGSIGSTAGPTILGIQPYFRHRRDVAGSAAAITACVRNGGVDGTYSASLDSGNTTYKTFRGAMQETDPATGAAWTLAGIATAMLKIVHDAGTNKCWVNAAMIYIAIQGGAACKLDSLFLKGTIGHHNLQGQIISPIKATINTPKRGRSRT